jgi:hypothetical protein
MQERQVISQESYFLENPKTAAILNEVKSDSSWYGNLLRAKAEVDMAGRARVAESDITQVLFNKYTINLATHYPSPFQPVWRIVQNTPHQFIHNSSFIQRLEKSMKEKGYHPNAYDQFWMDIVYRGYGEYLKRMAAARNTAAYTDESSSSFINLRMLLRDINPHQPVVEFKKILDEQDIAWKESAVHPLSHLFTTIGVEWEHPYNDEETVRLRNSLIRWGYAKDHSGHDKDREIAPLYAHHADTLKQVVQLIYDHQIVNTYESQGHSIHTNWGGSVDKLGDQKMEHYFFTRWLQGTAWAYYPFGSYDPNVEQFCYRIYEKGNEYIESKEFTFMGIDGLKQHIDLSFYGGSALNAYYRQKTGIITTPEEKALAAIYTMNAQKIKQIYSQLGWTSLTKRSPEAYVDAAQAHQFALHIKQAFRNPLDVDAYWRQFDEIANPALSVEKTPVKTIRLEGKEFPNMVAASRYVGRQTILQVQEVFTKSEKFIQSFLGSIKTYTDKKKAEALEVFFKRFPCGLKNGGTALERKKILNLLFRHYKIT